MDRLDQNLQRLAILVKRQATLSNESNSDGASLSQILGRNDKGPSSAIKVYAPNNCDQEALITVQGNLWQRLRTKFWKKS